MFDAAEELLQDFLIEAGELLDGLGEQLMALEHAPDDAELLNALFRSFHTIKGGAGFMGLAPLVEVCHRSEDVFNGLRQGELSLNPEIMDAVLAAVDAVTVMFDALRAGQALEPADPGLLAALEAAQRGETGAPAAAPAPPAQPEAPPEPVAVTAAAGNGADEITDDEFERLLDELHGAPPAQAPVAPPDPPAPPLQARVNGTAQPAP
ncbi:Hpt domain-containing protein, partial [Thioalkalivibrio sp. XN279]|uniref:Hpt domain-containing protein n=1 Tax=Thioalkalivibrio sp. XN279 TaxID=2714953 RepID=UPI00197E54D9